MEEGSSNKIRICIKIKYIIKKHPMLEGEINLMSLKEVMMFLTQSNSKRMK